jgi:hypothetical protein
MSNSEPEEDLSGKLRAWKVSPPLPPDFQREVWQRIAAREASRDDLIWPVHAGADGVTPSDPPLGLPAGEDAV